MRADRLLAIVLLLQGRGRLTAADLARRLEVSERTIYRDIEALSAAGVPVYAERGPGGGCALLESYRTTLTGLTATESRALFLSVTARPLADLGLRDPGEMAVLKLLAALPAALRTGAEVARQRVHLDPLGWNQPGESVPRLPTLHDAIWGQRRLRLDYHRRDDATFTLIVEPLGLVAKAGIWYLIARAVRDGDVIAPPRSYRVSRVTAAVTLDETFDRPAVFDLPAFWEATCAEFSASLPRYPALVRVAPFLAPRLSHILGDVWEAGVARARPPDPDGWVTTTLIFETGDEARGRLLGLGAGVEALAPAELRVSLATTARAIARLYPSDTT